MSAKSTREFLLDMGFASAKIEKAISACGDNVEQAMEWLLSHAEEIGDDEGSQQLSVSENAAASEAKPNEAAAASEAKPDEAATAASEAKPDETMDVSKAEDENKEDETFAKSIKCDDCGKLFKNSEEVEYHAVKSGHSSFSESTEEKKPLTEEEKQQKLRDLEAKLKERRKEKEEEERKESIEREKKRIQMSREIADTKRRIQEEEIKRIAMERKREKMEDKMARQRVKDQIERDKEARKEMFGGGAASSQTKIPERPVATGGSAISTASSISTAKKEYDTTRLQIRLPSGTPLVQEFKAKESLSAVRLWISLNRNDKDPPPESFQLSTTFPRKSFTDEDMDKPLNILGLVPSAVLVVTDK